MSSSLQPELNNSKFYITSYGKGFIEINGAKWCQSCLVSTSTDPIIWEPEYINDINESNLKQIRPLEPEIIILGTGENHLFLPANLICFDLKEKNQVSAFLGVENDKNISLNIECMSTAAACRTFNILASENRKVVAAILIGRGV